MQSSVVKLYNRFNIGLVLAGSLLFKLIFILAFKYRFYIDAIKAAKFDTNYFIDKIDLLNSSINSKTFLGPLIWTFFYNHFGAWGLKAVNLACFILLFAIQYFLGSKLYKRNTIIIALFLFSFYVGTNLNIIAGEPDDNIAVLLFSSGILLYVYTGSVLLSSLLMGVGFLFKFSTGIFYLGFILTLLIRRDFKGFLLSAFGIILPFICINFIDNFNSSRVLIASLLIQSGFSGWGEVGFKLLSTGMLLSFLISLWVCFKEKNSHNFLFFMVSSSLLFYVLINRDAYSSSYIMMQSVFFSSFLIAEFILKNKYFGKGLSRKLIISSILIIYLLISALVVYHNISKDTNSILTAAVV